MHADDLLRVDRDVGTSWGSQVCFACDVRTPQAVMERVWVRGGAEVGGLGGAEFRVLEDPMSPKTWREALVEEASRQRV